MNQNYGLLLNEKNLKLWRKNFEQMVKLVGVNVVYRAPQTDKHWTTYAEIESNYQPPEVVGCIFDDHPTQQTMKKLGWNSELVESAIIIEVPYDLHDLQVGALFIVPSGIDCSSGRLFRVSKMTTGMICPSSIACQLVPEFEDTYVNTQSDYHNTSFNLLSDEEEEC